MNKKNIIGPVIRKVRQATHPEVLYEVFYTRKDPEHYPHEFLFFIKPEITAGPSEDQLEKLLNNMLDKTDSRGLHVRDIRILSAAYLEKYNIIAQHYGVINALSTDARGQLSPQAAEKFSDMFGMSPDSVRLLGGLEFLEHFQHFDPVSLNNLWQGSRAVKLGPGTYCASVNIGGEDVYLVNGFHPLQLAHYTKPGSSIVALTLAGKLSWHTARNDFIGLTNPAEARPGSLRNDLYVNKGAYGLEDVSASLNGFHLSAGPLEGLAELIRYNSDQNKGDIRQISDFAFGRTLLQHYDAFRIESLMKNETLVHNGKKINAFDLTEETDSHEALQLLQDCLTA